MDNRWFCLIFIPLLWSSFLYRPLALAASPEVGGSVLVNEAYYPQAISSDLNRSVSLIRSDLDASLKAAKNQRLKFSGDFQWRPDDKSTEERTFINVKEAYWDLKNKTFQLRLGLNSLAWGVTDGYNPLDVTNPRELIDPLQSEKIGVPSIWLNTTITSSAHIEAIYIPWQLKSKMPGIKSRWLPHDGISGKILNVEYAGTENTVILPPEIEYQYLPDKDYDHASIGNFGLRLQMQVSDFDFSIVAFQGAAPLPQLSYFLNGTLTSVAPNYVIASSPLIQLQSTQYRQNVVGASLVATLGGSIFRAETAYSAPQHPQPELRGAMTETIIGVERSMDISSTKITGVIQASLNHSRQSDNSPTTLTALLNRAVFGGVRVAHGESLQWYTFGGVDTQSHGSVMSTQVTYSLSDLWKVSAEALVINGKSTTILGSYNRNGRVALSLTRIW